MHQQYQPILDRYTKSISSYFTLLTLNHAPPRGQKMNPCSGRIKEKNEKKTSFVLLFYLSFASWWCMIPFLSFFWALVGKGQFSAKNERLELILRTKSCNNMEFLDEKKIYLAWNIFFVSQKTFWLVNKVKMNKTNSLSIYTSFI